MALIADSGEAVLTMVHKVLRSSALAAGAARSRDRFRDSNNIIAAGPFRYDTSTPVSFWGICYLEMA